MNLRRLDLNLLVVFDAVYSEGNITRAAARLSMSQPAVSNAVARLRTSLGDDLFVRSPIGIKPTERANQIAGPVRAILSELGEILQPLPFQSDTASGVICVAAVDFFSTVLLPGIARHLQDNAPGVSLRILPTAGRTYELIDRAEADIGIASFGTPPARFGITKLMTGEYVCVMRQGHPALMTEFTPEKYAASRHILFSPRGDLTGATDAALAALGLRRQVVLGVSSFWSAVPVLENSDMIMTVPEPVAEILTGTGGLVKRPCPVKTETSFQQLDMVWHRRLGNRPLLNWFRDVVVATCDAP